MRDETVDPFPGNTHDIDRGSWGRSPATPAGPADRAAAAGPTVTGGAVPEHGEPPEHAASETRLNWLRAGVLGANDGIVSVAGIVVGVAGTTLARGPIFTAGLAGLVAGAVSMALGEYVSVSSQRDSEKALLAKERRELAEDPEAELAELAELYRAKGLAESTAQQVAVELSEHDVFTAHVDAELGLDPEELTRPAQAAAASAVSFTLGALLPLLAILLPPETWRVPATVVVVLAALALTGWISARLGAAPATHAIARVLIGGALGLAVTYGVGHLVGGAIG